MSHAQRLDKASGLLFATGFFLAKLQYIPFTIAAAVFRFLSLGLYLVGYCLWMTGSILHPNHKRHKHEWYGFAQIKEQFLISSIIGFIATALSVAAVFVPYLFPPAAWIYLIGNLIWTIGEYHKLNNPSPYNENFAYTQQKAYLNYAITTSVISLITAVAATLMLAFPPITLPVTIFSLLLCVGLGAMAFEFWLSSMFGKHKATPVTTNSYSQINDGLDLEASPGNKHSPAPQQSKGLNFFNKPETDESSDQIELIDMNTEENSEDNGFGTNCCL